MEKEIFLEWGRVSYLGKDGKEPAVLFIHGAGNEKSVWKAVMERLDAKCFAIDLPGHGSSSYKPLEFIEDYAGVVREFIEALSLKSFVLAGHSMGGAIAIKLSTEVETKGYILIGTGARLWVNPRLLTAIRTKFEEAVDMVSQWSFHRDCDGSLREVFKSMVLSSGRFVFYQDMRACNEYAGEAELKRIKVPVLILCGKDDVMTPPELSKKMAEKLKNSRLVLFEGCGHMVHMEKVAETAEAISAYLKDLEI